MGVGLVETELLGDVGDPHRCMGEHEQLERSQARCEGTALSRSRSPSLVTHGNAIVRFATLPSRELQHGQQPL
jgi:hypothetical protein